ncbi:hypothetical protein [Nocardia blacklockiae]|uniref:hypothetical protein n=1 Tax=Nocardia blacklockiae TaxID=480036 RepID=UPI0018932589|nr:hypothetical protein [Nocardia blacklockiae]MBF6176803.1 hypothetical protein [Nocardia blacklockiae]
MSKNARPKSDANETALRAVMAANPGATVSALAYDAGMSVSTARAILGRMADDGTAVRVTDPDAPRATYRWSLTDTATGRRSGRRKKTSTTAPATPPATPAKGSDDASSPAANGAGALEKLPSGALRGMVEDHLRANPGESFSPTALKRALEEVHAPRQLSSGAISNALEKLTSDGIATRTSDAPKKWALAAEA